jgi:hypothetical protein
MPKKITPHPFVAAPNNKHCSSCNKLRSDRVHRWNLDAIRDAIRSGKISPEEGIDEIKKIVNK